MKKSLLIILMSILCGCNSVQEKPTFIFQSLKDPSRSFGHVTFEHLIRHANNYDGLRVGFSGRISVAFEAMYMQPPHYPLNANLYGELVELDISDAEAENLNQYHGKFITVYANFHKASLSERRKGFSGRISDLKVVSVLD